MKRTHTVGLIAAALVLAAAGVAQPPGSPEVTPVQPEKAAAPAPAQAPAEPLSADERQFEGRWQVDIRELVGAVPQDNVGSLPGILDIVCGLVVDIRSDRTGLVLVGDPEDAALFPWKADGTRLVHARLGNAPRGDGMNNAPGGLDRGGVRLVVENGKVGLRVDWFHYGLNEITIPLRRVERGADANTAELAGYWRLSYDRTVAAIKAERAGRESAAPETEVQHRTIERELKSTLGTHPPTLSIGFNAGATPPSPVGPASTRGAGWANFAGRECTWGTWGDTVVLFVLDGWHGIKPNTHMLRVGDGGKTIHMRVGNLPLVLEREE